MSTREVHADVLPPLSLGAPYYPQPRLVGIDQLLNANAAHHDPPRPQAPLAARGLVPRAAPATILSSPVTPSVSRQQSTAPLVKFPVQVLPSFSQFSEMTSSDDVSGGSPAESPCTPAKPMVYETTSLRVKKVPSELETGSTSPISMSPAPVQPPVATLPPKDHLRVAECEIDKKNNRRRICVNAKPSASCHLCRRKVTNMRRAECRNLTRNLCRKVVCEVCFHERNWDIEAATRPGNEWLCLHCTKSCPPTAHCYLYDRMNARRAKRAAIKRATKENN